MLIKFDFETGSEEEILRDKLRELKGMTAVIESRLSNLIMEKDIDRRLREDEDYF